MARGAAILFAVLVCGCATIPTSEHPALTSAEIWERHHELDGQKIIARGWLQYCEPLGCRITDSRSDRDPGLSIGSSASFDREVTGLIGRQVIVAGELDATCLHISVHGPNPDGSMVVCTDRASEIENPRLLKVI